MDKISTRQLSRAHESEAPIQIAMLNRVPKENGARKIRWNSSRVFICPRGNRPLVGKLHCGEGVNQGISSIDLGKLIGMSQKSAWERDHAIRQMMDPVSEAAAERFSSIRQLSEISVYRLLN
jgi:hypothetical protein